MSYDITIGPADSHPECKAEHAGGWSANMTSNVAPVWRAAGVDLSQFDGLPAGALIEPLARALVALTLRPEAFREHVRGGGEWGTVEGCRDFLASILEQALAAPSGRVEVSS